MNQRQRIATPVILTFVAVVAPLAMCQPWKAVEHNMPQPAQSPIKAVALEEDPNATGYMRFLVEEGVGGEAVLTHELRMPDGEVLATQVYTVTMAGVYTDTVAPPLECLTWGVAPDETAEIWAKGLLYIDPPSGSVAVSVALHGIGYSDLGTPIGGVDARGFYLMGTLRVYKLYFPLVINESK